MIMSYHSLEDRRVKNLFKYGKVEGDHMKLTANTYSNSKRSKLLMYHHQNSMNTHESVW